MQSRGGRVSWDYAGIERFSTRAGGDASLPLGQQTNSATDIRQVGGNGESEEVTRFRTKRGNKVNNIVGQSQ